MNEQSQATSIEKWLLFSAFAIAIILVDIDMTAVNLALATIASELNTNLTTAQWIVDGYTIAAASLMALGGRIGEIYGIRRVYSIALFIFAISSVFVGISQGEYSIMLARILQGACVAFTFPIGIVLARSIFPKEQQGFAIGLLLSIASLAQAFGPTFSGIIIELFNWRWIFFINVPLCLYALIIIHKYYHADEQRQQEKLPIPAIFSLVCGMFLIITALNEISQWGITSWQFIISILAGLCLLAYFIQFEITSAKPFLELKLLSNKVFAIVNIARTLLTFVYFSLLFILSLFMQNVLDYSPIKAGTTLLFMTLVFGIFALPAGKLIDKIGFKHALIAGTCCSLFACLLLTLLFLNMSEKQLIMGLFFAGIAVALFIPSTTVGALVSVPKKKIAAATSVLATSGFIGASLGIAVSGSLLAWANKQRFMQLLHDSNIVLNNQQLITVKHAISGAKNIRDNTTLFHKDILNTLVETINQAFTFGFTLSMLLCLSLVLLSLGLALAIKKNT